MQWEEKAGIGVAQGFSNLVSAVRKQKLTEPTGEIVLTPSCCSTFTVPAGSAMDLVYSAPVTNNSQSHPITSAWQITFRVWAHAQPQ
jgi:hypothetical protein